MMKKFTLMSFILVLLLGILLAFRSADGFSDKNLKPHYHPAKEFNEYWYNNEAEITRFELKQARYGEIHEGDAIMIFVSEHISPLTYLKAYNENNDDIPCLKMNLNKHFVTGIYPYDIMTSVWTPVNLQSNPKSLRSTFSAIEWCGHMYAKCDLDENTYNVSSHSYFPAEGEILNRLTGGILEDELWNRIRIAPDKLPVGKLMMLPSFQHIRLMHIDTRLYEANAELTLEEERTKYSIVYDDIDRKLSIWFRNEFPFQIIKWEEEYRSGLGENSKILKTEAVATDQMKSDYWTKNTNADRKLRLELGLN